VRAGSRIHSLLAAGRTGFVDARHAAQAFGVARASRAALDRRDFRTGCTPLPPQLLPTVQCRAHAGDELLDRINDRVGVSDELQVVLAGQSEQPRPGISFARYLEVAIGSSRSPRRQRSNVGARIDGRTG
jgi:hypothetical protein